MRLPIVAALVIFLPVLALDQARASEFADRLGASEIGILVYCRDKGFADADAVAAARTGIARELRGDVEREQREGITGKHLDPALARLIEASGRDGVFLNPDGRLVPLADYARSQHMSVAEQCHKFMAGISDAQRAAREAGPPPIETPEMRRKTDAFLNTLRSGTEGKQAR